MFTVPADAFFFSGKLVFRGNRNQYKSSSYLRCFHRSVQYCILRRSHRSVHCCIRIMPWSASQQTRLGYEKQLLEQYFRGNRATWIDPTGNARVEIRVTCSSNRDYTLRIYIPVDFPNACPQMVVCNPSHCLVKRNGTVMNSADSDDHTWGSKDGCTQNLSLQASRVDRWQHVIPSDHERFNLAGGVWGTSSYWKFPQ